MHHFGITRRLTCCRYLVGAILVWTVLLMYLASFFSELEVMEFICEEECFVQLLENPFSAKDEIGLHIRNNVLDSYQERVVNPILPKEILDPPWKTHEVWRAIMGNLQNVFVNIENGTFVEVGAGRGDYLSYTAWLEVQKDWKGLLIEPLDEEYQHLRQRRKSIAARACVSDVDIPKKEMFWMPRLNKEMSQTLKMISRSSSSLLKYVDKEDVDDGETFPIQCFSLNSLIKQALGQRPVIHLLVLDVSGGAMYILRSLIHYTIYFLVIRIDLTEDQYALYVALERLDLIPWITEKLGTFHIYHNRIITFRIYRRGTSLNTGG